ncbi:MAG: hypothetical protein M1839_002263 [Geoglossum umbratile]|nr:MAG: hypothetical protein M1839_002263 [Geoglossum umbratile]
MGKAALLPRAKTKTLLLRQRHRAPTLIVDDNRERAGATRITNTTPTQQIISKPDPTTDGQRRSHFIVLELPIRRGTSTKSPMTSYATRQPLQTLVMATQPPERRRSARLAFGEGGSSKDVENGGSAPKRTKRGDDGGKASGKNSGKTVSLPHCAFVQFNGIQLTQRQKLGKKHAIRAADVNETLTKTAVYDEEDDGFVFRRTRSTRSKAAPAQAEPIEVEIHRPQPKRKTFLTPVAAEGDQRKPKRRKSQGEVKNEMKEPSGRTLSEPEEQHGWKCENQSHRTGDDSIAFVGETEAAAAAARDTTKIQIPFADTPVINRNKQLRQQHGQGHRRSSVGLRGRRASSLIDSGSAAIPHTEVDVKDFYKHISEDGLSEPRRMKQLLTWCGTRALGEKPSYSSGDGNAKLAARVIQEELLKDFSTRSEMSDWFNREDDNPAVIAKKPNPQNASNAAKIQVLEAQLKRIEEEKSMWLALQEIEPAPPTPPLPTDPDKILGEIDSEALDAEQAAILTSLREGSSIVASAENRLKRITSTLEFTVDQFADGLHKLGQYHEAADRVAGRVLALAAERLDRREKATLQVAGTGNMPLQDVLRSLARIER